MSPSARYSKIALLLHWLIALMIIGLIIFGLLMTNPDMPNRFAMYQLHKSMGISVLILSCLRLLWRLTHKPPTLPEGMKGWEIFAAKFTHVAFYAIMIGMPLLGWAMVSASPLGIPTRLFDIMPWPDMPGITRGKELEATLKFFHGNIGKAAIALIALHIGAALKHHLVNKDDVLTRMLPFARKNDKAAKTK
jgi:cytochrome b561